MYDEVCCNNFLVCRFYMANRMSRQRKFQVWFINLVTALATLAELLVCSIFSGFTLYFKSSFGPGVNTCYNSNDKTIATASGFGSAIIMAFGVSGLVIGMIFDIKMYLFLKRRRQQVHSGGVAMISWKQEVVPKISYGAKSNFKGTVPIKATALGAVNIVLLLPIMFLMVNQSEISIPIMKIMSLLIINFHMPLILLLTVKSNSKKAVPPQVVPPAELQFHEADHT